jgi:NTE family protein
MNATLERGSQNELRRLVELLQGLHFLQGLKIPQLDDLVGAMRRRTFKSGETVFKQGDAGDGFYIVASGLLSYRVRKAFRSREVAQLRYPDYFGEGALISDAPRAAAVVALQDSELYLLHKADFKKTLMASPEIAGILRTHMEIRKLNRA